VDYQTNAAILTLDRDGQTHTLQASLVVGADGARSQIRQQAGISTKGWKYWQSCVAFTLRHDAPTNDIAFERFWQSGPMGILPLPDNRVQIVWTLPHAEAQAVQSLSARDFLARLSEHTRGVFGQIELLGDRALFPVQLMQCDRYVLPRLALAGDAAHCCHPVGGQGLNLGIRDAASLAQILQSAWEQQQDIGSLSVLKPYERWRKHENLVTLAFTDGLDRLFSNDWLPLIAARRFGLWAIANVDPLKRLSLQLMTGLLGKKPALAQQKV
jgi:2-octaprenyl-6-methoxyphenol hydroxylase